MANAPSRSCNAELAEGLTDGKYKKVVRDRGGFVEQTTYNSRKDLADVWYGIHEEQVKMDPDTLPCTTPDFVATPHAELD